VKNQRNIRPLFVLLLMSLSLAVNCPVMAQKSPVFSLVSASSTHIVLRFTGEDFHMESRLTPRGKAQIILTKNGIPGLEKAFPLLPHYAVSLMVPEGTKMVVRIVSAHFYEKKNILILPSKGNIYRDVQQDVSPVVFGKVYDENTFFPSGLWETRPGYALRQMYGQTLVLFPFRYNPVKKILRIYDKVVFDITFRKDAKTEALQQALPNSAGFENVFRQHFLNYSSGLKALQKQQATQGMLIISYGPFIPLLKDFIRWKQQTGMHVEVVDVATIGNDAKKIKDYIRGAYLQTGISYVLLTGDAAQVPCSKIAGNDSDNDYAYVAGNDHYPDLFVGRFSAENATELTTMVNRTLLYEKALFPIDSCYIRAIGIASEMGTGYHDLTDYGQIRFIDSAYLLSSTYRQATELFDGSQDGRDANGDPDASMLTDAVNRGAGIINYCGHGSTAGWNTTHFDNSKVDSLENFNKWPFIISVSCATGNFVHQDCFAEHWLRAVHDGKPTGAVAVLMPTITQSWDPPMCGQQAMNALLAAPDSLHPPRTFAAICMTGCMKMNDAYGTDGYEITDTWTVFGDPSLQVRTAVPEKIFADYPATVDDTCTSVPVKTNLHSGRVALSHNGIIYAVAEVNSHGNALLSVDSIPSGGQVVLTITAFNHLPFIGKVIWEKVAGVLAGKEMNLSLKVFPNPAHKAVTVSFILQRPAWVKLTVWDVNGRKTTSLYHGEISSGKHLFQWYPVVPGIYFVEMQTGTMRIRRKFIFQK